MIHGIILMFLGISAGIDFRKKEISLWLTAIVGLVGLVYSVWSGRDVSTVFLALGAGGFLLFLSVITHGEIGMGDGWILMVLGLFLDAEEIMETLCIGFLAAAAVSLILLVVLKKGRKTEIPFVPFLLLGYVGGMFL